MKNNLRPVCNDPRQIIPPLKATNEDPISETITQNRQQIEQLSIKFYVRMNLIGEIKIQEQKYSYSEAVGNKSARNLLFEADVHQQSPSIRIRGNPDSRGTPIKKLENDKKMTQTVVYELNINGKITNFKRLGKKARIRAESWDTTVNEKLLRLMLRLTK